MSSSPSSSPSADAPRPRRATEAILTVLTGARAGHRHHLNTDFAALGRHPSSDLAFDAVKDLDVSARHAAVFRQGGGYVVRDLGSTNGTWVNGSRIRSERALEPGDRIRLGTQGPELEFSVIEIEDKPVAAHEPVAVEVQAPVPPPAAKVLGQEQSTTDLKIRIEVARQTDRLRRRLFAVIALVLIVVGTGIGWLAWTERRQQEELARERDRLLRAADSLESLFATTATTASALRAVLDSAQGEAVRLRESIATRAADAAALASFDSELTRAAARNAPLLRAARFDATAVAERNARAVVIIFAEFADAHRSSATGFVVRTRADTAWVITSRHAVLDAVGQVAGRLGLSLTGSGTVYRARFLAAHDSADIALLRVVSGRSFPTVQGVDSAATPQAGDPVALIGFPLGLDLPMGGDWRTVGVTPSTFTGTVSRTLADRIQVDGYGAAGASGSPVFNAAGDVIGVLYGGEREGGGRIVYAARAQAVAELLRSAVRPAAP